MKITPITKKPKGLPSIIKGVNNEIDALTRTLRGLNYPKLDNNVYDNCSRSPLRTAEAIIVHRFTKYWELPESDNTQLRRFKGIQDWWVSDERVKALDVTSEMKQYSYILYQIGTEVLSLLKRNPVQINFGPGESFKTQMGRTHLLSKLDPATHTVSYDCLDLWKNLICQTRGLFLPYMRYYIVSLKGQGSVVRTLAKNGHDWRRHIVSAVIDSFNDYVVYGSRQAFVPKDNDEDRAIEINPLGDVVLQKHVGDCFRAVLKKRGIDLDDGQQKHVALLQERVSTLDASKASDTITRDHLYGFPVPLQKILCKLSQEFILVENVLGERVWHKQAKLCSMGNGFTFELLTTIMFAVASHHDKDLAYVYGDDVIVSKERGLQVAHALERVGFIMNEKKSFIDNPVRESCGGFFVEGYGYVTTFKLEYCKNLVDVVKTANKLYRVYKSLQNDTSSVISPILQRVHERLLAIIPTLLKGPESSLRDLPDWVETKNWLKSRGRSVSYNAELNRNNHVLESLAQNHHRRIIDYALIMVPTLKNEVEYHIKGNVKRQDVRLAAVKLGRRVVFEKQTADKRCVLKTRVVVRDGYLVS